MTIMKDKVAIITGSTQGIGEAIARRLSLEGSKVVINSLSSAEKGEALAEELGNSIYCQGSIANDEDCNKIIDKTLKHFGRIDFLINNAGANMDIARYKGEYTWQAPTDNFSKILDINVVGTWRLTQKAIPHLQKTGDGVIINVSSIAGIDPAAGSSSIPYSVSKAAVNLMTKALAKDLGPEIRVNAIAPGLIKTRRAEGFTSAIEKFEKHTPLKRIGEKEDVVELVLAMIRSNYITGEVIVVDGGFSIY